MPKTPEDMALALSERFKDARLKGVAALAPAAIADRVLTCLQRDGAVTFDQLVASFEADLADPGKAHLRPAVEAVLTHLRGLRP